MANLGLCCLPGRGHLNPASALGRELKARGHRVVIFSDLRARGFVRKSGLEFVEVPRLQYCSPRPQTHTDGSDGFSNSVGAVDLHASQMIANGLEVARIEHMDAFLVDQADLASGSIAEALGVPFITLCFFPPVYLADHNPLFTGLCKGGGHAFTLKRIRDANTHFTELFAPTLNNVARFRKKFALPMLQSLNEVFSSLGIITQLPEAFELPKVKMPARVKYTSLFYDGQEQSTQDFPWHRLNGRPIVFMSFGTVQNTNWEPFRLVAEAVADMDIQLVVSLGGGRLIPDEFSSLHGDAIVDYYVPQMALLRRACLTVCHGGLNTTLESLISNVPVLAIPVTDDQPGVASRIQAHSVGHVLPYRKLSEARIRSLVEKSLDDDQLRTRVKSMHEKIHGINGAFLAADWIESLLGL